MLKTRIILVVASLGLIVLLFLLPKVVVDNENELESSKADSTEATPVQPHVAIAPNLQEQMDKVKAEYKKSTTKEKSIIFADSLADLYTQAGKFDSAAWYAEEAVTFLDNTKGWTKAGDRYYQAFTFAIDADKQALMAKKAQDFYQKVLAQDAGNLTVKTKLAMTYMSSSAPMQGISLLREVLAEDPKNEEALFNLGMLSLQSGQDAKAVDRLEELITVNPNHVQGNLLLGVALSNTGKKERARAQFEKVKKLDKDPAVQATADSYLKDLK